MESRVRFDCEADVLEGLEQLAHVELIECLGSSIRSLTSPRPGTLRFDYTGDLQALLDLRSCGAVYLVRHFPVPRPRALLGHQHFEALAETITTVRALFPPDAYRTLYLSAAGESSSVLTRLKTELAERTGLAVAAEEGDLLLRLRRGPGGTGWEALVRLSPRPLATRQWRVCHWPGSLNATLAYAMMRLTEPAADDRVLNLACGSGTLLVERLAQAPARLAIGCDTDAAALDCARRNLHAAGYDQHVRLEGWNAGQLPLEAGSVSVICADLPFGQLVGSHRQNEALYPRLLAEAARVAMPGARMVLLTHEVRLLERVAQEQAGQWYLEALLPVRSSGMTPRIYLFRRLNGGAGRNAG